ncbi:hypothetical protein HY642_04300 [Candidatus Woesearchaeota archaeon]|nr:hypothetical protein [Candidatus Woesearchaeota archaeon]
MQCSIYCSDQLDGIASAAIVLRALRMKNIPCKFAGVLSVSDRDAAFDAITGHALFLLDVPPLAHLAERVEQLAMRSKIIYWSMSAPAAADAELLSRHAKTVDVPERRISCAEVARDRFLPGDKVADQLANLAHDIKFWIRADELSVKLADLIIAGYEPRDMVDSLSKGVLWSPAHEQEWQEYRQKRLSAIAELKQSLQAKQISSYLFGFCLSENILSTADAGQSMLDTHTGIDIACVIFRNGRIAFRRREGTGFDMSKLAVLFSGSGGVHAAAGTLGRTVSKEKYEDILASIERRLKDAML